MRRRRRGLGRSSWAEESWRSEITVFDERDGGTFFGFSDPEGNTWAVQQLTGTATKPLIPVESRGRFVAD